MTPQEFKTLLKTDNLYAHDLGHAVTWLAENRTMVIKRKDRDLVEVLNKMLDKRIYPLVDKRLRLVFGVGESNHGLIRVSLFRYHNAIGKGENVPHVDPNKSMDEYLRQGMGYYFSSMDEYTVVAGIMYREDSFDRDVFLKFSVNRLF